MSSNEISSLIEEKNVLRLAIQKSGRLHDDSMKLLKECGIDISNGINKLKSEAANFPIELYFLRDDDIPQYVEDGVADIGFVGENVVFEKKKSVEITEKLGFGKCRLSFAVRKGEEFGGATSLQGKRIATSYPVLVQDYLDKYNVKADIQEISGSVEIAPGIGLADVICDLVSSGSTLFMNGLKEADVILQSQAVLITNQNITPIKRAILESLIFRIQAVRKAKNNKYVLMNAPNEALPEIEKLLPGMKSPTILPLAVEGWSSIHVVLSETQFWEIVQDLKKLGAEGILVLPIEKMVL
ncbi:ATP phosphoribosyltransferase [Rhizosphaericola mali]|uniref:ATP phosphoribosyltransferase n=1 Tax=Rhizosphaericola mali TaxID=2545455 RepID=A0A5P2FWB0_9BACT|nr:ATP phosphoribosyltransferase [Rhizosphaericola mali]QES87177.1 ATP phosphoribosyltransferase [Rhizosphaericola mali]